MAPVKAPSDTPVMEPDGDFRERAEARPGISDDDVRAAKRQWLAARDGDGEVPDERVETLFERYRTLISRQAQQLADEVRRNRPQP